MKIRHHLKASLSPPNRGRGFVWRLAMAVALFGLTVGVGAAGAQLQPTSSQPVSDFKADVRLGLTRAVLPSTYHLDISFDRDDLVAVLVRAPEEASDLVRYTTKGFSGDLSMALGSRPVLETVEADTATLVEALRVTVQKEISEFGILGVTIVTAGGTVHSQDYRPQSFERCSLAVKFSEEQEGCHEIEHDCDGCSVSAFCCGGGAPCSGCTPNCWIACPPCIEPSP